MVSGLPAPPMTIGYAEAVRSDKRIAITLQNARPIANGTGEMSLDGADRLGNEIKAAVARAREDT